MFFSLAFTASSLAIIIIIPVVVLSIAITLLGAGALIFTKHGPSICIKTRKEKLSFSRQDPVGEEQTEKNPEFDNRGWRISIIENNIELREQAVSTGSDDGNSSSVSADV